ncbi:MAG: winged helix-turn-helix domain-containing protein [Actinophytocola sp.]|uniref:winged helix-turn-helix domain-containing protein n=1 Tax=Actinophytocola sp. TaxID=1872138 RepID=UPI001326C049|nr:crosslink repair DNA glycosylase YcaQ family protein [Actinophytocola sp.]MPZ81473.1 winged helix-turn-helix domain-containing protein [Actinophytocola sp.]
MSSMTTSLSAAAARRIALAAQGFADARPAGEITRRHLRRVLDRVRLIQLDSVNVAVRAHYMPLFSRLGAYPAALVDDAAWEHRARRPRMLVEYWAHEASLLPVADWPLFRWRMRHYEQRLGERYASLLKGSPGLFDDVLAAVKDLGSVGAGPLEQELGMTGRRAGGGWWNRSSVKHACEYLFAVGELTTGARRGFQRLYDLPERVLPPEVHGAPELSTADAVRELTRRAATAHGIATEPDLRDYYRIKPPERSREAVAELVEEGLLEKVEVRGWPQPAYRHVDARQPRRVAGRALLCPFDPLIWERARTERIFDFHYRIEIYVPEPKRVYGYYVFPFLLDGELVARVDLKADRQAGTLRVRGAFAEPAAHAPRVAAELATELQVMAEWLELDKVAAESRGSLAPALRAALP